MRSESRRREAVALATQAMHGLETVVACVGPGPVLAHASLRHPVGSGPAVVTVAASFLIAARSRLPVPRRGTAGMG